MYLRICASLYRNLFSPSDNRYMPGALYLILLSNID